MRARLVVSGVVVVFLMGCVSQPNRVSYSDSLVEQRREAARLYQKKAYREALPRYRKLAEVIPNDPLLQFRLGNLYAHLKQPDQAIAAYRRAVRLNPRLDKAWYNMAVVQLRQAANSLTQMLRHADPKGPLYPRARQLSERVVDILAPRDDEHR